SCSPDPLHLTSFPTRRSSDLRHRGLDVQFRRGLEPGAEEIGGTQLVEQATLHDANALFVGIQRNITVRRRLKVEASAEVMHRPEDRKSTRLNSSHDQISYAVF